VEVTSTTHATPRHRSRSPRDNLPRTMLCRRVMSGFADHG